MGSFALGYLMGMTLSGPNYTPDGYGDNFDEKELKRINDEMYWNAWDSAMREGTIKGLIENENAGIETSKKLGITKAQLIEYTMNGEIKTLIVRDKDNLIPRQAIWADENREEAKLPSYQEHLKYIEELKQKYEYRIV